MDRVFETTFLVIFPTLTRMEAAKSLNCCVVCTIKLFSKSKRLYKRLRVLHCDCLGDQCRWCYLWRMQEACRRAQTNRIVYFYRVIAISSYRWSFDVITFLLAFFRASTVLLVLSTSNFSEKFDTTRKSSRTFVNSRDHMIEWSEVYLCLKSFFWRES